MDLATKQPAPPPVAVEEPRDHAGVLVGYVGSPPAVAAAALKPADATLKEMPLVSMALADLNAGALDAAVVDYPSVVFASRKGTTPFHIVLLVSWRYGADAITVKNGGPWKPAGWTDFAPATSGEYIARLVLDSSRYSPQEKAAGRKRLDALASGGQSNAPDAAAGRLDRMTAVERGWPRYVTTEDLREAMPDVLVVNTKWARREPKKVTALARAWLDGQKRMVDDASGWKVFVEAESRRAGLPFDAAEEEIRPAPLAEQLAFVGLAEPGLKYTDLALHQGTILRDGPTPSAPDFTVLVDSRPMADAIAKP
jgi:ABC-type nitrate/sulfonate/bicarbonate transport system substrate-binding protein